MDCIKKWWLVMWIDQPYKNGQVCNLGCWSDIFNGDNFVLREEDWLLHIISRKKKASNKFLRSYPTRRCVRLMWTSYSTLFSWYSGSVVSSLRIWTTKIVAKIPLHHGCCCCPQCLKSKRRVKKIPNIFKNQFAKEFQIMTNWNKDEFRLLNLLIYA